MAEKKATIGAKQEEKTTLPLRFVTITPLFNYYLFDAPIAYSTTLKSTLQSWSIDCAKTVFNSRQVHREWQWWLNQAFQSS